MSTKTCPECGDEVKLDSEGRIDYHFRTETNLSNTWCSGSRCLPDEAHPQKENAPVVEPWIDTAAEAISCYLGLSVGRAAHVRRLIVEAFKPERDRVQTLIKAADIMAKWVHSFHHSDIFDDCKEPGCRTACAYIAARDKKAT